MVSQQEMKSNIDPITGRCFYKEAVCSCIAKNDFMFSFTIEDGCKRNR
jgi:hypothetical protein